jgi:hypothetical protein
LTRGRQVGGALGERVKGEVLEDLLGPIRVKSMD